MKGDGAETGEQLRPEGCCCVHDCCCMGIRKIRNQQKLSEKHINHHLYCLQDDVVERSSAHGASPSPRDGTGALCHVVTGYPRPKGPKGHSRPPHPCRRIGDGVRATHSMRHSRIRLVPLLLGMQVRWLPNVFVGGAWLIKRQMSGNERASPRTSTFSLQQLHRHRRRRRLVTSHPVAHPESTIPSLPTDRSVALATPDPPKPPPPPQPGHHRNGAHRRADNAFRHLYCPEQQSPEGASPRWTGYNTTDSN